MVQCMVMWLEKPVCTHYPLPHILVFLEPTLVSFFPYNYPTTILVTNDHVAKFSG